MNPVETYWWILLVQFIAFIFLPFLIIDKKKKKLFIKVLKWIPLMLIIGFIWDNIMAYFNVWVWGYDIGPFVWLVPFQDLIFIIEIFLIPALFTIIVSKEWD